MLNPNEQKNEAPGQKKETTIIINGRETTVTDKKLSFTQIVTLAFPNVPPNQITIYTVTYKRGEDQKPEGSMVEGDVITIKKGMIFNVTPTNKS